MHLVISAQKHWIRLRAVREHQGHLFWHPASPWDQLMHPACSPWLHHHDLLSRQQDCLRDIFNLLSKLRSYLSTSVSTSATMWGTNSGQCSGRISIDQDIAAGMLTVAAQQGVKKRPSSHWGAQQTSAQALGLHRCASAGSRVHQEAPQLPQRNSAASGQFQPSGLPSCTESGLCALSEGLWILQLLHTHRVCSYPLVWQQPGPDTGLCVC